MVFLLIPVLLLLPTLALSHMTPFHPSMFGFNGPLNCHPETCDSLPSHPVGPNLTSINDWWFRGPNYTSPAVLPNPRNKSEVAVLPAGGSLTLEIACTKKFTSYGTNTTLPGSHWDACPSEVNGYHADPLSLSVNASLLFGCALGIFDGENWQDATMDNIVIFSVQPGCVKQKVTQFDVPSNMPNCKGDWCVCAWFWLPESGIENFYMTGFYCSVKNGSVHHRISAPKDPVNCQTDPSKCVSGAKKALYAYNRPTNVNMSQIFGINRPGYHAGWSFTIPGAQWDIFEDITPALKTSAAAASHVTTVPKRVTSKLKANKTSTSFTEDGTGFINSPTSLPAATSSVSHNTSLLPFRPFFSLSSSQIRSSTITSPPRKGTGSKSLKIECWSSFMVAALLFGAIWIAC